MTKRNITSLVPTELEGVATTGDVSALGAKIERCYSSERYEDFQEAVEKIIQRYLKGIVGWTGLV